MMIMMLNPLPNSQYLGFPLGAGWGGSLHSLPALEKCYVQVVSITECDSR